MMQQQIAKQTTPTSTYTTSVKTVPGNQPMHNDQHGPTVHQQPAYQTTPTTTYAISATIQPSFYDSNGPAVQNARAANHHQMHNAQHGPAVQQRVSTHLPQAHTTYPTMVPIPYPPPIPSLGPYLTQTASANLPHPSTRTLYQDNPINCRGTKRERKAAKEQRKKPKSKRKFTEETPTRNHRTNRTDSLIKYPSLRLGNKN
jgi:hypothetical protein